MLLQDFGFVGTITDFISMIFEFLSPILIPIGEFMIRWIEVLLPFFPTGNYGLNDLGLYLVIFVILIFAGVVINSVWPGDKVKGNEEKGLDDDFLRLTQALSLKEWKDEKDKKEGKSKKSVETLIPKAKEEKGKEKDKVSEISESNSDVKKCKECDMPIGDSDTCPYCGASN